MEDLSKCPFCFSEAALTRTKDNSGYWFVQCKGHFCGCRIFARPTREESAEAWNQRAN